jgi:hypothetical protein
MASVSQTRLSKFNHSLMQLRPYQIIGALILGSICLLLLSVGWWLNRGDWIYPDQVQAVDVLAQDLVGNTPIGQTFTAYQAGLEAIEVKAYLPNNQSDQPLTLHLREGVEATQDLRQVTISTASLTDRAWARFSFDPLPASRLKDYYFFVEGASATTSDGISLYYGPPEAYLDGAAYLNGYPQEAQLAFRLVYDRPLMFWDLIQDIVASIPGAIVIMVLLICPGGVLLAWLWPEAEVDWFGWLTLSLGVSLALFPLLFLFVWLINGKLSPFLTWGGLILSAMLLIWRATQVRLWIPATKFAGENDTERWYTYLINGLLVFVVLLVVGTRLAIIRNVTIPFWGDSVQHAVIAQRMVEEGGLFDSWLPYANFKTLTIHFGFHSLVALLTWLLRGDVPQRTLLAGQIANMAAVLTLYPIALYLSGKRWAGIAAILIAGLLMPMPMYYVNWGRYPQLAGQAILPVALWLFVSVLSARRFGWRWLLVSIVSAGLFLTYYRMPIFLAPFILLWLIKVLFARCDWTTLQQLARTLGGIALVGGVLLLPWLIHVREGQLATRAVKLAATASRIRVEFIFQELIIWQDVLFYSGLIPLGLAIGALLWSIFSQRWQIVLVSIWYLILVSSPFGRLLPIPLLGFVESFSIIITIYIPVALLVGWLAGEIVHWLQNNKNYEISYLLLLPVPFLLLGLWGAKNSLSLLVREHQMVFKPDERAMNWISRNTPVGSRFFVDGFTVYNDNSVVGADAGWWIPLLANRENTMPPQYALLNEAEITPGYSRNIVNSILAMRDNPFVSENDLALLKDLGVTHIYSGQAQGKVNNPFPLINPQKLAQSPNLELIYREDRVWIFALAEAHQ